MEQNRECGIQNPVGDTQKKAAVPRLDGERRRGFRFLSDQCLWPSLQQAALSFEQHAAFALASHVAHSFLLAQDARSIEDAASRIAERRIMLNMVESDTSRTKRLGCLLTAHHRWRRRRRRGLLAGAEDGGSRDKGEDSDFHVCLGVNQFVKLPIHQTPGSGIFRG